MRRYRHHWPGSMVLSVVNPVLFLVGVGLGIGALVDPAGAQPLAGVPYIVYFAPGLLAASAMQTAFVDAAHPVFDALHRTSTYRAAVATPLRTVDILLGHLLFVVFRLLTTSLVFVLVMILFGAAGSAAVALLPATAILTGITFAALGMTVAARAARTDQLASFFRFVILPLYLFSGTFFAVENLPEALQVIAYVTPLWHGVELSRGVSLGTMTPGLVLLHAGYLVVVAAVCVVLAHRAYRSRLES
jgi:lipooligosaccharide transport system permease protein